MSFLFISGCKPKITSESNTNNAVSKDSTPIVSSEKDTLKIVSVDSSKVIKKQKIKNQAKDTVNVNKQTTVKKDKTPPPSENPVMRPVTAYGIQTNDYKVTIPKENNKPNE